MPERRGVADTRDGTLHTRQAVQPQPAVMQGTHVAFLVVGPVLEYFRGHVVRGADLGLHNPNAHTPTNTKREKAQGCTRARTNPRRSHARVQTHAGHTHTGSVNKASASQAQLTQLAPAPLLPHWHRRARRVKAPTAIGVPGKAARNMASRLCTGQAWVWVCASLFRTRTTP